jgi:cytochrome c oxidase subunit 3
VGTLGMWLFLGSLTVLFAASITGYLVVRSRSEMWPPAGMPALPAGLWVSTVVILCCSGTIHWALSSARGNRYGELIGALLVTSLLGLVFLVSQVVNWAWLISIQATASTGLYMFTFYWLTGLHGLHVVGGLVLLGVVTAKAFAGRYTAEYYPGVKYAAMYWHFLDVVWLVMFTLMFLI